ncbi:LytR C-terminal domain-containing protein [Azohydromonas aeria]|uniref:LytR C-terminal domain-containing protein n=1 Tax=Azohydromonas aeria TaxID=2590212 RepID=UPI0018DFC9EA|nr:LytR C-terminal domain-containing protein [Azohydromonas aeria]
MTQPPSSLLPWCAALLLALGGCATQKNPLPWRIEPVQSVKHGTASAQGYYVVGRQVERSRDWMRAADAYRQALRLDPGHVDARNALAVALAQLGLLPEAEAQLRLALAAAPQRADLHSNLGYLLLLRQRPQQAQAALQEALALDPHNPVAQANLLLARGRTEAPATPETALARAEAPAAASAAAAATTMPAAAVPAAAAPPQQHPGTAALQASDRPTLAALDRVQAADAGADTAAEPGFAPAPPLPSAAAATAALPAASPEGAPAPAAASTPAARAAADTPAQSFTLELSNGAGRRGAATELRTQLQRRGFAVHRTTNQTPYRQRHTVVLYQPGQEAAARRVARSLPLSVPLQPDAAQRTGVRVLIGRDWPGVSLRVAGTVAGSAE